MKMMGIRKNVGQAAEPGMSLRSAGEGKEIFTLKNRMCPQHGTGHMEGVCDNYYILIFTLRKHFARIKHVLTGGP